MREVLDPDVVDQWLREHEDWTRDGAAIRRDVQAPSFLAGIDLVRRVADAAEHADHHPDIDIRWRTVTFRLSTHSSGGITRLDLDLAEVIDAVT